VKLLDLFCCAGGAGEGYQRAGFDITGIDINPQPHNPHKFIQADAFEYLEAHGHEFDAIHASPPCQIHSVMTKGRWKDRLEKHKNLIPPIRELLIALGKPYVIENVEGSKKHLINPTMLCGTMFGLETKFGSQLRRHRLFETSFFVGLTPSCNHKKGSVIGVYGGGQHPGRRYHKSKSGELKTKHGVAGFGVQDRRDAMGIDWMTGKELSQAIPPAYTEFIGKRMMEVCFK